MLKPLSDGVVFFVTRGRQTTTLRRPGVVLKSGVDGGIVIQTVQSGFFVGVERKFLVPAVVFVVFSVAYAVA